MESGHYNGEETTDQMIAANVKSGLACGESGAKLIQL
jgi:hypothetical protein